MPLSGQSPFGWASSSGWASATLPNEMPPAARRRSTRSGAAVRACPHCTVATLSGASAVEKPVTIWLGIAIWLCIESWDAALRDCRSVRTVHHALRRAQTLPARPVSVAHGRGTCDGSRQERHLQPGRQHDRCHWRESQDRPSWQKCIDAVKRLSNTSARSNWILDVCLRVIK